MNFEEIKKIISGQVITSKKEKELFGRDASIFEVQPEAVVQLRDVEDVKKLVKYVSGEKTANPSLSLTARAGGTDMTGGPLNESIIIDFASFNKIIEVESFQGPTLQQGRTLKTGGWAVAEPGVYYRDFEKATLAKGLLLPSYPASREICTVGGMVANNAGGEKSLKYGKTANYIEELNVVLGDGEEYALRALSESELEEKKRQNNFEGTLYARMDELIRANYKQIQAAKPNVSKNSAGYALWDVWDKKGGVFDLTKLFCGSQGTLGLITKIKLRLIKPAKHSKLLVIFLKDLKPLAGVINEVMKYEPESFEAYDDNTLKLAVRFWPEIIKRMKGNVLALALRFIPEAWMLLTGGMPKIVLIAEFTADNEADANHKAQIANRAVKPKFQVKSRIAGNRADAEKYWAIRRESFNLLRKHVSGKKTAPFIDDVIVRPDQLPEFLPRLNAILEPYKKNMVYTIAGHAGDANFHVIPLMDLAKPEDRALIPEIAEKVYNLVVEYGGSITAEHNDGMIRTPYLKKMFDLEMIKLFEETKKIFDPQNIFNPGKKVKGDLQYALRHIALK